MTHLGYTVLLGAILAMAHALLGERRIGLRFYHAACIFCWSVLGVIGGSWVMRWIEG